MSDHGNSWLSREHAMKRIVLQGLIPGLVFVLTLRLVTQLNVISGYEKESLKEAESRELPEEFAFQALRWYNDQRAYPTGSIPLDWREKALAQVNQQNLHKGLKVNAVAWKSLLSGSFAGRTRSIVINPVDTNVMYCGSVSGGVWKTTNGGAQWFPTTDAAPNLAVNSLAMDPTNPNILYAATGEGSLPIDALRGVGVLKTADGGTTWTTLNNFANPDLSFSYYYINKIVVNSRVPGTLYAGMLGGIWKSTDAGASWSKLNVPITSSRACMDLVANPSNPNTLYASFGWRSPDGVYKTVDAGRTWSKLTNGFPARSTNYHRISLAIATTDTNIIFACLADSNEYTHSIQKSTNSGASWFALTPPFDNDQLINGTHLGGQGWYDNVIAVDPTNSQIVYTGGINLFKSTDGGTTWNRFSDGYAGGIHVDQHAIVFSPRNASTIFFGNDGGVFKTTDAGATYSTLNNGLTTVQFYSIAVHPSKEIYYGGTQDNGTMRFDGTSWAQVLGGDGGPTFVDQSTPTTVYGSYVYLLMYKSTSSGAPRTWVPITDGIPTNSSGYTSDRCSFIAPYTLDPSNSQILVAGTYRAYRTTSGGNQWNSISPDLTGDGDGSNQNGQAGSTITAIAIAKSSSATIYVGTSGSTTASSRICVTTNTGGNWFDSTASPLPDRQVTSMTIDRTNAGRAFVAYSGYNDNTPTRPGHVFLTTNTGSTWMNVSGDLPDVPVNTIILDPLNANHILVGTDIGIFESADGGSLWLQQNSGLANVAVDGLVLRDDRYLFAATHGRGMFKSSAPLEVTPSSALSIIVHQNPVLTQYVDVYVAAQESLSAAPTIQVSINGGAPQSIPLQENSERVFKGSYRLTQSGSFLLTALASDSIGGSVMVSRSFQAQLVTQGSAQAIASIDGRLILTVANDVVTEDTYFMIQSENSSVAGSPVVSTAYTLGPAREFLKPLSIALSYTDEMVGGGRASSLSVYRLAGDHWLPVTSRIDARHHRVLAQITSLGTVALGYDANGISQSVPSQYVLHQNYPNPFNPTTAIRFDLSDPGYVSLKVFNILGQEVRTLVDGERDLGQYEVVWDGKDDVEKQVASGIYFYRLVVRASGQTTFSAVNKMILMK